MQRDSQSTQNLLQHIHVDVPLPNAVRQGVETGIRRERGRALKTPGADIYDRYQEGSEAQQQEIFRQWKIRYLRRGKATEEAQLIRRFKQYLSYGKKIANRQGRTGGQQAHGVLQGGVGSIQRLLGKNDALNLPQYLWVRVYVTRLRPVSERAVAFSENDVKAKLMTPMVYIGHRRDSKIVRDRVRIADARRRANSANGLTELTRHYLDAGLTFPQDFDFEEIEGEEVLGEVDHGHGNEASNAMQASIREDLVRIAYILDFLDGDGPRPLNAKLDNSLLGVTSIKGLLRNHDTPVEELNDQRIKTRLNKAKKTLERRYEAYRRRFIKNDGGLHVLPLAGTTKDGIGQTRTAEVSQTVRRNRVQAMTLQED